MVTVHLVFLPLQAPDQPRNQRPFFALALSVTSVSASKSLLQARPQRIPFGSERTAPRPLTVTLSATKRTNVAVTARDAVIVVVQVSMPEQASPDQPAKREPTEADAVSVTRAPPSSKSALQMVPQAIPAPVTVPLPEPVFVTVSVWRATKLAL